MFYIISFDHSNEILYTVPMLPVHLMLLGAKIVLKMSERTIQMYEVYNIT